MTLEIEEFAELLIREVRDRAIVSCDSQATPESQSPSARRWRQTLHSNALETNVTNAIIPDCIDDTLFHLLFAIDSGALQVSFVASNGKSIDLTTEGMGELAGWYMMGKCGWRHKYSQQRVFDDLSELE